MAFDVTTFPKVALSRAPWLRLIFVGIFVHLAIERVLPDAVRAVYPLHYFDDVTIGDAIVVRTDTEPPKGSTVPRMPRSYSSRSAPWQRARPSHR